MLYHVIGGLDPGCFEPKHDMESWMGPDSLMMILTGNYMQAIEAR